MKKLPILMLNAVILFTGLPATVTAAAAVEVTQLRCEQLVDPLGIDVTQPRLSWQLAAAKRGTAQTAYEILVASSEAKLAPGSADLWASGKVATDQSILVRYAGKPLTSRQVCVWKVRVWDQSGKASAWSQPATWSLGLLQPDDWRGQWIGKDEVLAPGMKPVLDIPHRLAARMLRKEFVVAKPVARATAYTSGLGLSELYLNGRKVGDQVSSPALSDYTKRVFYVTHDVTAQLQRGPNALGVWLGNGRFYGTRDPYWAKQWHSPDGNYGFPKLKLQLEVDYADGTRETVVSDASWKLTADGPIIANNEWDGEEYDARKEMPGWDKVGFQDAAWSPAQVVAAPGGPLVAPMMAPMRVTGTLQPIAITEPKPGVFIYDMGQNMVGWCRLKVSGPTGTRVTLRHAEILNPDGTLYLANLRSAKVTDIYTLSGSGTEIYEPRFTYHGFRYVEVTGFPGQPTLAALEGRVVNDDLATAGEFTCSQPTINQVYRNIVWGTRGNYRSIPTDCPQRDERQGWLGDRSAESKGEAYLFDVNALYAKWCQDMADTQQANGSISDVCPAYWRIFTDSVTWPSSMVIIPGTLLEQYGDTATIARIYPAMVKWVDLMSQSVKDGLTSNDFYGDWCVPPEDPKAIHSNNPAHKTSKTILATSYLYYCLKRMADYAQLLDKPADAQRFTALAETLKTAFNAKLYNAEKGYYDNGSQTSCVLPLAFDLVPTAERPRVFAHLVKKIEVESSVHVGTGLIGGQWINRVLTEGGRPDLVYRLATNTDYPSWGYMVSKGATTIWELWNGDTANPSMNSGNHVMLVGDLVIWFYEDLSGIKSDPAQPGFKHIVMKPHPVGDLNFARATHRSPYGLIVSDWKRADGAFDWQITVPPNTTATIYIPTADAASVTESGKPIKQVKGVTFLRQEAGAAIYTIGAGTYRFHAALPVAGK